MCRFREGKALWCFENARVSMRIMLKGVTLKLKQADLVLECIKIMHFINPYELKSFYLHFLVYFESHSLRHSVMLAIVRIELISPNLFFLF